MVQQRWAAAKVARKLPRLIFINLIFSQSGGAWISGSPDTVGKPHRNVHVENHSNTGMIVGIVLALAAVAVALLFVTGFWSADVKGGALPKVDVKAEGGALPDVDLNSK
ncbi:MULTISPECIES: hypothetical protein [Sphingomonadaceae]|uniref:hypothetical protein n=1 Tax=Sphingomonadales TaxID=204457 RepID=UPI0021C46C94|nr:MULTISPECIES: hypothetical protein [Sphingomonadaceae]WCP12330.1 hypothetical protein sphantq_00727 [Sphingobium sp. AntQ-1]